MIVLTRSWASTKKLRIFFWKNALFLLNVSWKFRKNIRTIFEISTRVWPCHSSSSMDCKHAKFQKNRWSIFLRLDIIFFQYIPVSLATFGPQLHMLQTKPNTANTTMAIKTLYIRFSFKSTKEILHNMLFKSEE